jgi:hypothetical protein
LDNAPTIDIAFMPEGSEEKKYDEREREGAIRLRWE